MKTTLFDLDTVAMYSPRLTAIKDANIQSHYAPHAEPQWIAIPMNLAKEMLEEYDSLNCEFEDIGNICASFGMVLDDLNLICYGNSKEDVENQALALAARKKPT